MPKPIIKLITVILFIYSCIFSFALIFGAVSRGLSLPNMVTILLFLPVVYYFVRELNWQTKSATGGFAFLAFVTQRNTSFILTLVLFVLSLTLTVLKSQGFLI